MNNQFMKGATPEVRAAYEECIYLARDHVKAVMPISWLMPGAMLPALSAIVALVERLDQIAYEQSIPEERRLTRLDQLETDIHLGLMGEDESDDPITLAICDCMLRHDLPIPVLQRLLKSGKQRMTKQRFDHFSELMEYAKKVANPEGELLLHLTGKVNEKLLAYTNGLSTSLFLLQKFQNVYSDYTDKGHIFLPQDDMQRFGVTDSMIIEQHCGFAFQQLMKHEYARVDRLLRAASPLGKELGGRAGILVRTIIMKAARKLYHLKSQQDLSIPV